jgi:hypothetical protein
MDVQAKIGLPLDAFIQLYDAAPFELIDGERIPVVPGVAEHGEIIKWLYRRLMGYESQYGTIA